MCFAETAQYDKIVIYCQKVNYTADWSNLLRMVMASNADAQALQESQGRQRLAHVLRENLDPRGPVVEGTGGANDACIQRW